MANVSTTFRGTPSLSTTATIYNLAMPIANTEYGQLLANHTKKLTIRSRLKSEIKLAFVSGNTATIYLTLAPCAVFSEENLDLEGVTIYASSNVAGNTLEILEWT